MAYNPNLFSVTNVVSGQMTNGVSGPTTTTTSFSPSQPVNGNQQQATIVSVNPLATIVQTPSGQTQLLNPGVGYTGLANVAAPQQASLSMAPGPPPPGVPSPQGNQIPNWYNIQNTPALQTQNAFIQNVPGIVHSCEQNSNEAAQALLHAQGRSGAVGPLGMNGITSNEFLTPRRTLNMNRPPSNKVFPPLGIPGNKYKQPYIRHAMKNVRNHEYCPEMYMTPYDRTPNKIATGVLTNPYTGEVFQTFEEGMPLPQKNDSLLPSQLKVTNPKLVQLQGGIDYNAPPPSKQEIAQNVPLINGGPNVWGDALYQPQLRQWFDQRATIQQWNNRNGILPNYGIQKEHPAGFIGPEVNYLRPVPYNPATMRNTYNLKDWKLGVTDANYAGSMDTWNVVQPVVNNLDPNRGQADSYPVNVGPVAAHNEQVGVNMTYDSEASLNDLRATQKTLQEQAVPLSNIQPNNVEGYIYNPPDLKATQKTLQENTVPLHNITPNNVEGYVYDPKDFELRATQKTLQEKGVPIHNVSPDLPHTEIDLTASSEKTETKRQYYDYKNWQTVANVDGSGYSVGYEGGPQPYAEWTRVAKRGGSNAQTFRVVPNRVTDSLSNEANFSVGCSQRDTYPEQPNANMFYGSFVRPSYADGNAYQQTDFSASLQRPLPATTHCFKKGTGIEQDTSQYTLQPMALSLVGSI